MTDKDNDDMDLYKYLVVSNKTSEEETFKQSTNDKERAFNLLAIASPSDDRKNHELKKKAQQREVYGPRLPRRSGRGHASSKAFDAEKLGNMQVVRR